MQVKIPPPAASPAKRHSSVTSCTTDFTATTCPPCRQPPSRRAWQHCNMRAQSLAFPNFSLAKHLSLHPAAKLWQAPQASRDPSDMGTRTARPDQGCVAEGTALGCPLTHLHTHPAACPAHTAVLSNTRPPHAPAPLTQVSAEDQALPPALLLHRGARSRDRCE